MYESSHCKFFSINRRSCFSFFLWLFIHIRPQSVHACAPSSVTPEECLVLQHTGQFMVEGLVKLPEEVSGGWKHRTQVPVCCPPSVRHGPFGQCYLYLLWQRTCKKDGSWVSVLIDTYILRVLDIKSISLQLFGYVPTLRKSKTFLIVTLRLAA